MPKMKVESLPKEKKDFFYEITGTLFALLALILLGRFGSVGNYLSLLLHILFGDYVFVLFIFLFVLGLRGIIKKKFVNVTSINFIGFWVLYLGISLFCTFSIYNGLETTSGNFLSQCLSLYKRYLKVYQASYTCGGGLIGAVVFQVLILFFGQVGVYLFAVVFCILGLFFLSGLTFFNIFKRRHGIIKILKSVFLRVVYFVRKIEIPKGKIDDVKIYASMLTDSPKNSNLTIQKEYNQELAENLTNFMLKKEMKCTVIETNTSYYSSRVVLSGESMHYIEDIKYFFMNRCFVIKGDNRLYLDYANKFKSILSLKGLLSMGLKYQFPLGVEVSGEVYGWNYQKEHLFVVGDEKAEITEFLKNVIVMILLTFGSKGKINFVTLDHGFIELASCYTCSYINNVEHFEKVLDELIEEYERREELLRYLNIDRFSDLKHNKNVVDVEEIFTIVRLKYNIIDKVLVDKLNFLLKNATRYGIYFIVVIEYVTDLSLIERQNMSVLLFKTNDILMSLKTINEDIACYLNKNGECLYMENKKINHLALGYVTDSDYQNVLKKFTG